VDDLVGDVVVQLLQRKLLMACDRKFKKPKPGRTKLVKWPRTLEAAQVRCAFCNCMYQALFRNLLCMSCMLSTPCSLACSAHLAESTKRETCCC
jgi:hypothetical protein